MGINTTRITCEVTYSPLMMSQNEILAIDVLNKQDVYFYILKNNIRFLFLNYLGIISLGLYPLCSLGWNACVFGYIAGGAIEQNGICYVIQHVYPHIFELIPIIFSTADATYLSVLFTAKIFGCYKETIRLTKFYMRFIIYIIIIMCAAFCEAFLSM